MIRYGFVSVIDHLMDEDNRAATVFLGQIKYGTPSSQIRNFDGASVRPILCFCAFGLIMSAFLMI